MKTYTYKLTGKSIKELRKTNKFYSDWSVGQKFESSTTKPITITIPKDFWLEDSFNKTYQEQQKLAKKTHCLILEANQLVELLILHHKKTGKWLTQTKDEYDWVRSSSLSDGGRRVGVQGCSDGGVRVSFWRDGAVSSIGLATSRKFSVRSLKPRSLEEAFSVSSLKPLSFEKRIRDKIQRAYSLGVQDGIELEELSKKRKIKQLPKLNFKTIFDHDAQAFAEAFADGSDVETLVNKVREIIERLNNEN